MMKTPLNPNPRKTKLQGQLSNYTVKKKPLAPGYK
jgi:hypothetical protein